MTLDGILQNLREVQDLEPDEALRLLAQAGAVKTLLEARVAAGWTPQAATTDGDRLLTVEEASERLRVSVDWLYRTKNLPFRVQVTPSQVRFSSSGIEKWIRARKGA